MRWPPARPTTSSPRSISPASNNLRLVVKGGGHSYQGTSNAADSLLIWTRRMNAITVHDAFVGTGCAGQAEPQPAVTVEAGAIWGQVYDAVTTKAGRYVQGGGCLTVGVAGLIQSGGFGSFSKAYGMAAASLLEAEIVTADGAVRIANACTHPDLFWAIKGGGGGSFGVVTRLTLRTHDLPEFFGAVFTTDPGGIGRCLSAADRPGHRLLRRGAVQPPLGRADRLPPGECPRHRDGVPGPRSAAGGGHLAPVLRLAGRLSAGLQHRVGADGPRRASTAFLGPRSFSQQVPGLILADDRPGAPETNVFWASNLEEAGQVLHGYQSAWLPASLLQQDRQENLADALFAATRHWSVSLHFNKGLAGAPADAIEAARRHGDQSGGARRLRAGHQRGRGTARLSRPSRSRARPHDRPQPCGGDRQRHE